MHFSIFFLIWNNLVPLSQAVRLLSAFSLGEVAVMYRFYLSQHMRGKKNSLATPRIECSLVEQGVITA